MVIKPIIYIVLGIVIGIALAKLFTSTQDCPETTAITKPFLLKEKTSKKAMHLQERVDSLSSIAKEIERNLTTSKAVLVLAKNKTLVLQTQFVAAKEKVFVPNNESNSINFPPEEDLLTEFIDASTYKDSLYETIDSTRVQQLQNKDAVIAVKDSMYDALSQSFNYSLSQQEVLFSENKLLRKQINRQKVRGRLVSAAVLVVCASAVRYLVR